MAKQEALVTSNASELATYSALSMAPEHLKDVIQGNFGRATLNFSDLERIPLPGGGGLQWSVQTAEGEKNIDALEGIIVAWADKKAWWEKSFDETGGGVLPDCRSEDMIHGLGNPALALNQKETVLVEEGKARATPLRDAQGYLCVSCVHNLYGTNSKGEGKACQDKRLLFVLDKESLLPSVIVAPATSILPMKQYFGRLAKLGIPFFGAITKLQLEKLGDKIRYSVVKPTMVAKLDADMFEAARAYSKTIMPLIQSNVMNQEELFDDAENAHLTEL